MKINRLSDEQWREVHARYGKGELLRDLSVEYGVCVKTLTTLFFQRLGLPKRYRKNPKCDQLSYDIAEAHKRYVAGESPASIARDCGVRANCLVTRFKQRGMPTFPACRRPVGSSFARMLGPVDTHEGAYWLGLMFADGCLIRHKGKYRTTYSATILLQTRDRELLDGLAEDGHGVVYAYPDKTPGHVCFKSPASMDFEYAARHYGLADKKAKRLVWPEELEPEFYPAFVRGFFDGDGSFYAAKRNAQVALYSICWSFLESLQAWLVFQGIPCQIYTTKTRDGRLNGRFVKGCVMHSLRITRHAANARFASLIYTAPGPRLDRKCAKFHSWLQYRAKPESNVFGQCNA